MPEKSLYLKKVKIMFFRHWMHEFKGGELFKAELHYVALYISYLYV